MTVQTEASFGNVMLERKKQRRSLLSIVLTVDLQRVPHQQLVLEPVFTAAVMNTNHMSMINTTMPTITAVKTNKLVDLHLSSLLLLLLPLILIRNKVVDSLICS